MISKIINMAERMKDDEDRLLESILASESIADDGFGEQVIRRVRRKLLVRRLTVPVAALIGGAIAFKPLSVLVATAYQLLLFLPDELVASATNNLPSIQFVVTGGLILFAMILGLNMLED